MEPGDASDIDGQTDGSACAGAHESKQGQRPSFKIAEHLQAALAHSLKSQMIYRHNMRESFQLSACRSR